MATDPKTVTGRAKGGVVVAAKMSPEERKARSTKGSIARWGLKATHKGNFKDELGIDVECYVLNDPNKTAVISQSGMAKALGITERGNVLERFISSQAMAEHVVAELAEKLKNPLVFQWDSGVAEVPAATVKGFEASLLIDLCNSISSASVAGKLGRRYDRIVQQASIINGASAKAGITGLVYALAGYRPEVEEVITAFKAFVQAEARKYASEFPPELYLEWARLYGHKPQRSWKDMHLTINHVYYPLAKSDGKLLTLLREAKSSAGDRNAKLFQFLNIVGARALRFQLGRVFDVAESSSTPEEYEAKIAQRFGGQQGFKFTDE